MASHPPEETVRVRLKPLAQQVIVITGATSGIGLVTARKAAKGGARLVLAARNQHALDQITAELRHDGSEVVAVATDVGKEMQVHRLAQAAIQRFGGFDTWVNNAGVSIYGSLVDISLEDQRRLFDTNFWGVVHGSREAVKVLRRSDQYRQRAFRPLHTVARDLLRFQACREGLYRFAADGGRGSGLADLCNLDQAKRDRYSL
jgi:NAD(P)-dependent dehydrogenase (short-subunit alcohol dehydrogenase family)